VVGRFIQSEGVINPLQESDSEDQWKQIEEISEYVAIQSRQNSNRRIGSAFQGD
jgi:hypothetical protein